MKLSKEILENRERAVETLSREELGIEPRTLGGSAIEAAITSFLLFTCGAVIPLISFFVIHGIIAVITSLIISSVALFGIGAAITLFTGRPIWLSGGRQVLFGLLAAALTFGVGSAFGILLGV